MARKYARDNRGRFAPKGTGATARGGRLKTAGGNKRQGQTVQAKGGRAGTIGKPKGLKPARAAATRPDTAMVNIPMSGSRGRRLDAEISRNVKAQKTTARVADKARNRQYQSDQARAKKLRAAHVGAIAEAKGISKGQVESALKAQSPSTQIKALKNWVKQNRGKAKPAAKPAVSKVDTSAAAIARRRSRAMTGRSSVAGGQFNMKLNTRSQVTRSAANEIYNRQRQIAKASGGKIQQAVARDGIGALPGLSGSKRQRAEQLREKARRRVVGGRRR